MGYFWNLVLDFNNLGRTTGKCRDVKIRTWDDIINTCSNHQGETGYNLNDFFTSKD